MTAPTLQALLAAAKTMACGMLADHGKILPCAICHKADGDSFIIAYDPAPTVMQRRFVALEIGKKLREANAAAYVVLHEVWIGDHPSRQAAEAALVKGPPSKSPERIDGALIEAHDIASTEALMFKIDRSGKKPNLVPLYNPADDPGNAVTDRSSIWDGLLDEPANLARRSSGKKVGRNEPCPCGSGRKYKRCCGAN